MQHTSTRYLKMLAFRQNYPPIYIWAVLSADHPRPITGVGRWGFDFNKAVVDRDRRRSGGCGGWLSGRNWNYDHSRLSGNRGWVSRCNVALAIFDNKLGVSGIDATHEYLTATITAARDWHRGYRHRSGTAPPGYPETARRFIAAEAFHYFRHTLRCDWPTTRCQQHEGH
jgi:hypothetical protein